MANMPAGGMKSLAQWEEVPGASMEKLIESYNKVGAMPVLEEIPDHDEEGNAFEKPQYVKEMY